jgi:hypothetical protein
MARVRQSESDELSRYRVQDPEGVETAPRLIVSGRSKHNYDHVSISPKTWGRCLRRRHRFCLPHSTAVCVRRPFRDQKPSCHDEHSTCVQTKIAHLEHGGWHGLTIPCARRDIHHERTIDVLLRRPVSQPYKAGLSVSFGISIEVGLYHFR